MKSWYFFVAQDDRDKFVAYAVDQCGARSLQGACEALLANEPRARVVWAYHIPAKTGRPSFQKHAAKAALPF